MTRSPHRALDIARKIDQAAIALLPRHNCRLVRPRLERIRQFRRVGDEAGNHRQNRVFHRRHGYAILRPGDPVGIRKAVENLMLLLDARKICVAGSASDLPVLANAEHIGQAEIGPLLVALVVQTGLERRQQ